MTTLKKIATDQWRLLELNIMRGGIDTIIKVVKSKGQIRVEAVSPRYDVSRRFTRQREVRKCASNL